MKALKQKQATYTSLHLCLEAHFGEKHSQPAPTKKRPYREPEQGFRTVLFQSRCPLTLDYMSRRRNKSFLRTLISKKTTD